MRETNGNERRSAVDAGESEGFIDRFEGDIAVIEVEGSTIDIPRGRLPEGAKAGDAVIVEGEEIRLDPERKAKREKEIKDLMDELWED